MAHRLLAAALVLSSAIWAGPVMAQQFKPGDTGQVKAICETEQLVRTALELAISPEQYAAFMMDPRVHCIDTRLAERPPFQFIVEAPADTIEVQGHVVTIWRLRVLNGPSPAYSWSVVSEPTEGQGV